MSMTVVRRLILSQKTFVYPSGDPGVFLSQPCDTIVCEGWIVQFNCTLIEPLSGEEIATWLINGKRHYWLDFMALPGIEFNLDDNSLLLTNVTRLFDGYTFQCVINGYASKTAFLTVLYPQPLVNTTNTTQVQSTSIASTTSKELLCTQ